MSINTGMNYEAVIQTGRGSNAKLAVVGIKADLASGCYKAIEAVATKCHGTLKAYNDEHFPRIKS